MREGETASDEDFGSLHRSVMTAEVLAVLEPHRGGVFVDATLGLGGHSEALLNADETLRVIGIDRDAEAIEIARRRLASFGTRLNLIQARYEDLRDVLASLEIEQVSGVLADLGVSSYQLDEASRGFSFRFDAPLDMRMNAASDEATAAELLATLDETELARIIYEYGEERFSRRIARRLVERRERGEPVETTAQLADLVASAVGYRPRKHKAHGREVHPATRTFQALRIATNRELIGLGAFIETAIDVLQSDGRLAVISFHSLEDRIVKQTFKRLSGVCECDARLPVCRCGARRAVEIITRRPQIANETETNGNPRARSAKLRACRKLGTPHIRSPQ